ncbi:MAG: hypothetical protein H0T79_11885 [Deltaproteobacteria bacterium]|nr:hypothetical protein [Deltaproteobacteria bacterium]
MAFSLRELRELEQRRISDEQTARRDVEAAKVAAAEAAEQRKLDTAATQLRAEREERYRIEAARAEAARQERLALEAHETAERARHQAMLDAERMREELDLRRIEASKKRPKWMVVVTALASVATVVLVWFTIQAMNQSDRSAEATRVAEAKSEAAIQARKDSDGELAGLQAQVAQLDGKVSRAVADMVAAEGDVARRKAKRALDEANEQKAATQRAIAKATAERDRVIRNTKVLISKDCAENALSKACLSSK